ncbi:hypothetical protein ACFQ07_08185, partial [Actinomadura adrarensis]
MTGRRLWPHVLVLTVVSVLVALPFLWMIRLAITPEGETFSGLSPIPSDPTLENFGTAMQAADLGRAFANSTIVTVVAVAVNCVVPVLA